MLRRIVELTALLFEAGGTFAMSIGAVPRTISTGPTLQQVVSLGIVVLIRTFLSFSLEIELEGRWPWQTDREAQ
jgi:hypothetical protein